MIQLSDLSPEAWAVVMRERQLTMSEADVLHQIAIELDRRRELHPTESSSGAFLSVWENVGCKLQRRVDIKCACGRTHTVK